MKFCFFKYFSKSKICDDLPLASGPSKVINKPFFYSSNVEPKIRYFNAAKTLKIGFIVPTSSLATKSTSMFGLPSISINNLP